MKKRSKKLAEKYPFPTKACHTWSTVPASRHAEFNNRQWMNPEKWDKNHKVGSSYSFITAFFQFGAYFDKMQVIFNS